jgi:hypothetical protein
MGQRGELWENIGELHPMVRFVHSAAWWIRQQLCVHYKIDGVLIMETCNGFMGQCWAADLHRWHAYVSKDIRQH